MDNKLQFVGQVAEPITDPIATAIKLIEEKGRKVSYDSKDKWLKFTATDVQFLKDIRKKMAADLRKTYGTSRSLNAIVSVEEVPTLYVHSDR